MTGPEHYREAERLAAHAVEGQPDGTPPYDSDEAADRRRVQVIALAQVHATLALAAGTRS